MSYHQFLQILSYYSCYFTPGSLFWEECEMKHLISSESAFYLIFALPQSVSSFPFPSLHQSFDISLNTFCKGSLSFPWQLMCLNLSSSTWKLKFHLHTSFLFYSSSFSYSTPYHFLWTPLFPDFLSEVTIFKQFARNIHLWDLFIPFCFMLQVALTYLLWRNSTPLAHPSTSKYLMVSIRSPFPVKHDSNLIPHV